MRTWIKNGARMAILVTAFAGGGAGVAYSQTMASRPIAARDSAGYAVVHLVSMRLAADCGADCNGALGTDPAEESTGAGGTVPVTVIVCGADV